MASIKETIKKIEEAESALCKVWDEYLRDEIEADPNIKIGDVDCEPFKDEMIDLLVAALEVLIEAANPYANEELESYANDPDLDECWREASDVDETIEYMRSGIHAG